MGSQINTIDLEQFNNTPWAEAIESCSDKTCEIYARIFWKKRHHAWQNNDEGAGAVYALLANICDLRLKFDTSDKPLTSPSSGENNLDEFDDSVLRILDAALLSIEDPELKARFADILLTRKHGEHFEVAQTAVHAYLGSAKNLEATDLWIDLVDRSNRALHIALTLGTNHIIAKTVIRYIESLITKIEERDLPFLMAELMKLLLNADSPDIPKYAALCEKIAKDWEIDMTPNPVGVKWERARVYWELAAKWHHREKKSADKEMALKAAAETFVKASETVPTNYPQRNLMVSQYLRDAIKALKKIPETRNRRETLQKSLLEFEKLSLSDLGHFHTMDDIDPASTNIIVEQLKGRTFHEALLILGRIAQIVPNKNWLETFIKEQLNSPIYSMMPKTKVDYDGKIKAIFPLLKEDNKAEVIEAEMLHAAVSCRSFMAQAIIKPVIMQLNVEHCYSEQDFFPLVSNSSFVPTEREQIFARGLCAGMKGDFLVSTHLLLPQIENSIRYVLEKKGYITSALPDGQIQNDYSLNKLFDTYPSALESIFGQDIHFDLYGLLANPFGSNLRNEAAHGLMSHDAFLTVESLYLYWLVLHLCCAFTISNEDD